MNWQEMFKFNEKHLGKFVNNKSFWKRFNELENLFEVIDDDLKDYERIKYITLNEFLLQNRIDKAIEYIEKNDNSELGIHQTEFLDKHDLLNILKGNEE